MRLAFFSQSKSLDLVCNSVVLCLQHFVGELIKLVELVKEDQLSTVVYPKIHETTKSIEPAILCERTYVQYLGIICSKNQNLLQQATHLSYVQYVQYARVLGQHCPWCPWWQY